MHLLEAGHEATGRPLLLLLHGFPELAYSWRRVMEPLAAAGFHVVAPDQRGYGRTTGWDGRYDGDVDSFRLLNLVRDALALVFALGYQQAAAVVGHDFGSPVAACCALVRPDVFRRVVLMSAPFPGPPDLPFGTARVEEGRALPGQGRALPGQGRAPRQDGEAAPQDAEAAVQDGDAVRPSFDMEAELASLPRPRKHYQWYYSGRAAEGDMLHPPEGLHAFLRAYFHMKSADWSGNAPHPLGGWTAEEFAKLPTYYVMDRDATMPDSVRGAMPPADAIAANDWLPEPELAVYVAEFARTGFQGGLNWYRCGTENRNADLTLFARSRIDVPLSFMAGRQDWGVYQKPGELDRMRDKACSRFGQLRLVKGAGHWLPQEQPRAVVRLLLERLRVPGR